MAADRHRGMIMPDMPAVGDGTRFWVYDSADGDLEFRGLVDNFEHDINRGILDERIVVQKHVVVRIGFSGLFPSGAHPAAPVVVAVALDDRGFRPNLAHAIRGPIRASIVQ